MEYMEQHREQSRLGLNMAGAPTQLEVDVVRCELSMKTSTRISSTVRELGHPTINEASERTKDTEVFNIWVDLQSILANSVEPQEAEEIYSGCLGVTSDSKGVGHMQLIQTPEQKQRAKVRTKSRRSRSGQLKVPRLLKNSSYPQIPKPSKESPSWPENLGISTSHISLPLINVSAQSVVTSVPRPTKALETVRFPRILKKKRNSPVHGSKMSDCQAPSYKLPDVSVYRTKQLLQRFKTQVRDQQRDKDRETDCEIGVPEYPDNLLLAATLQSLREQLIHLKGFDTKEKQGSSGSHPPLCQKMDTAKTERKMHRSLQPPYGTEQPVILSLHKRNLAILPQIQSNVKIM